MKSFIKGLWSRTKSEPKVRVLEEPGDLMVGDMIQLSDSFSLPPRLRKQNFKVVGVATQQFEHEFSTCFSLEGVNHDLIDLTIERSGGRQQAAFSLAIDRTQVEQVFDLDEFAAIFDDELPVQLSPTNTLDLQAWLAPQYQLQAQAETGYFHDQDCRQAGPSEYVGDGEPFDYYCLVSADKTQAIEIEVYAGGETEVSLTLYRPREDIIDMYPAAQQIE
ncbi:MAG: hypothetical protein KUG79_05365 [Pseudomonadales bacterium]|nr:hypothetical protein [Pseudomonadales bacterium]